MALDAAPRMPGVAGARAVSAQAPTQPGPQPAPHASADLPTTMPATLSQPAASLLAPAVIARESTGRWTVWLFLAFLSTYVFEGALRGGLFTLGLQNLLYVRDLVAVASIATAFALALVRDEPMPPGLVVVTWLLLVHLCIGLLMGGTVFQRLFGMKIFIPLLYAVAIFPAIERHFGLFVRAMGVFFVSSVLGVFINQAVPTMPWEGLSYDTAFGNVQATRQWWMAGGLRRLAGFARASFDAAMVIGVCGVVVLAMARRWWVRAVVMVAGSAAIFLTTSKGMVVAFAVAALWLGLANRSAASFACGRLIVVALALVTCILPTVFLIVSVPTHPLEVPELLSSLWDRFSWMWPSAYALLPEGFGALTGVGLGGIGTALEFPDERTVPNSGDSIFVYFFVTFGLAGVAYLGFALRAILHRSAGTDPQAFAWAGLLIIAFGYGLSINMVEQPFFASVFGLVYAKAFSGLRSMKGGLP